MSENGTRGAGGAPRPLTAEEAKSLAARAVEMTEADQAEILVMSAASGLTRFANNRIHQNVAETDTQLSVRAVMGRRVGVASTNRTDEASIQDCCAAAVSAAGFATEDPDFPGLPAPDDTPAAPGRPSADLASFGPAQRADAVGAIVEQSAEQGLVCAGTVASGATTVAVANSLGTSRAQEQTQISATVLSGGDNGGSGWSSFFGADPAELPASAIGDTAAATAMRSENPRDLKPGTYKVLLGPEAVGDLLFFLSYAGFSAKSVAEGRSFMNGSEGERLFSESLTITDDALAEHALGLTFDYEGVSKKRTPIVQAGVVIGPVTDSYWAARMGRPNTGHALPAPNSVGPFALDLEIAPGDVSVDDMIAGVDRGVYISRLHYVNIEEPVRVVLTGMTRDGTFMIENGRLAAPLKNLRFTQSAVEALGSVAAVGRDRRHAGDRGSMTYVPALLLEEFSITGQTA